MADKTNRSAGNADGKYYVDANCIACGVCTEEAPANFTMDDTNSFAFVKKQPADEKEKAACEEAVNVCPVNAIGNDG
jgi:ferredoxin